MLATLTFGRSAGVWRCPGRLQARRPAETGGCRCFPPRAAVAPLLVPPVVRRGPVACKGSRGQDLEPDGETRTRTGARPTRCVRMRPLASHASRRSESVDASGHASGSSLVAGTCIEVGLGATRAYPLNGPGHGPQPYNPARATTARSRKCLQIERFSESPPSDSNRKPLHYK
jgi:hypothetical protein